jgi:hypothetical protein
MPGLVRESDKRTDGASEERKEPVGRHAASLWDKRWWIVVVRAPGYQNLMMACVEVRVRGRANRCGGGGGLDGIDGWVSCWFGRLWACSGIWDSGMK